MDNLKALLSTLDAPSSDVLSLLSCLQDSSFHLDVHICSVGGVGSTELSNFFNAFALRTNLLSDTDNWRHCNRPVQYNGPPPDRVVYLFGDPLASIASHYRRGHAVHQAIKTSGNSRLRVTEFPATFDEYVCRGEDLFGYEAHMENWMAGPSSCDVLCLRYESMFEPDVAGAMLQHVCGHKKSPTELEVMRERWCAAQRPRSSQVPPEAYHCMYQDLLGKINGVPPVFIKTAGGQHVYDLPGLPS